MKTAKRIFSKVNIDRLKNTVDQVHEILLEGILLLEWKPGEVIKEKEICLQLGVSRTPVREALLRLSFQGLVNIFPQRGTYVSKINIQNVRDDHFIRSTLETAIIRELVENCDEVFFERMGAVLELQRLCAQEGSYQDFYQLDQMFHKTLAESARSERVWQVINSSKFQLDRIRNLTYPIEGYLNELVSQHFEIVMAIQEKNEERAVDLAQDHLEGVMKKIELLNKTNTDFFEKF